jgi:hypothetical protein
MRPVASRGVGGVNSSVEPLRLFQYKSDFAVTRQGYFRWILPCPPKQSRLLPGPRIAGNGCFKWFHERLVGKAQAPLSYSFDGSTIDRSRTYTVPRNRTCVTNSPLGNLIRPSMNEEAVQLESKEHSFRIRNVGSLGWYLQATYLVT